MILGSYRNPPYRTPTPKGKSISPPLGPSPKRKRTDSQSAGAGPALQIQTHHVVETTPAVPETPADSPRTSVVIDRFNDLDISQPQSAAAAGNRGHDSPRKRLRCNAHLQAPDSDAEQYSPEIYSTPEPSSQPVNVNENSVPLEISETPEWRARLPSRSPSASAAPQSEVSSADNAIPTMGTSTRKARFVSLPPKPPTTPLTETVVEIAESSQSQPSESDVDRAALTWQESEITGQDIDTTTGDDDGEGINGIGFRPTPAMAYARSQRRKQQVNEWKAREAREARQRRIERRRGAAAESKGRGVKPSVRFEGVG